MTVPDADLFEINAVNNGPLQVLSRWIERPDHPTDQILIGKYIS
jgi:hypothetical protein